jgi:hypothetical protein
VDRTDQSRRDSRDHLEHGINFYPPAAQTNKAPWGRGMSSLLRPFSRFDSTKGFPGEGPPRPELAFLRTWQGVNHE